MSEDTFSVSLSAQEMALGQSVELALDKLVDDAVKELVLASLILTSVALRYCRLPDEALRREAHLVVDDAFTFWAQQGRFAHVEGTA